ncbi:MAG: hypothetical protein JW791_00605 [Nanoarchaeota archaeon]|nr:hypothetical protein [Nanoarchaeota archaeon]
MEYEIDYKGLKQKIKKSKAKNVLVQLPDGLKQDYEVICEGLKGDYNLFFWAGSCFGACDIPLFTETSGIDLIIHLGHERWH